MATLKKAASKRVIGHLDLLGAQSMAVSDPEAFSNCLNELAVSLDAVSGLLGDGAEIYAFADCVYFEAENLKCAIDFAATIRKLLLAGATFFKCGIAPGSLGAQEIGEFGSGKSSGKRRVSGMLFGTEVVAVYRLHNALNGIGIAISPEFGIGERNSLGLFQNVFIDTNKQIGTFIDVRIDAADAENEATLKSLRDNVRKLGYRNRDLPRKYLPLIVNLVRSTSFARTRLNKKTSVLIAPRILDFFGTPEKGSNPLAKLPWYPLIQMALADQFEKTAPAGADDVSGLVLRRIFGSVPQPPIDLDRVPAALLSEPTRQLIMRSLPL